MATIPEFTHKINERLVLIRDVAKDVLRVRIRRVSDGYYFDPTTNNFHPANPENVPLWYYFEPLFDVGSLKSKTIVTLPTTAQDLLFEYESFDYDEPETEPPVIDEESIDVFFERHIFGGPKSVSEPDVCVVFGTLKDVSGAPLSGQKVEAFLNRAGFFTHKAGLIGYASTVLTDDTGYFELPLIRGLDVTVNVPVVGFSTRGFVPNLPSVELTTQALLSYQPG